MIIRIVKMTFKKNEVTAFLKLFASAKPKIRNFEGCSSLKLHQDLTNENIYYTISHWNQASDLEKYRNSEFFKKTWKDTKLLFADKPLAFSLKEGQDF